MKVRTKLDSDQKFAKQMVVLSMSFALVMTLGGLAISLLLDRPQESGQSTSVR